MNRLCVLLLATIAVILSGIQQTSVVVTAQRRQRPSHRTNSYNGHYCPRQCSCYRSTVRCQRAGLQAISYIRFRPGAIDLRYNGIRSLPARHFNAFFNLSSLLLDHNEIRAIGEYSFTGLNNLQYLYLYENRIRSIHRRSFRSLSNLKQLYLHANEIHAISPGTFWTLTNLERLFVSNNRLVTLPSRLLSRLNSITKIQLGGNPLKCDCNLAWLAEYVASHDDVNVLASCLHPREYTNYAIKDVPLSAFTCGGSSDIAPEIEVQPEEAEVAQGHIVRLRCQARGTPTPRITWKHDDETVEVDSRIRILIDGTLLIQSARQSDEGDYKCVASNSLGDAESRTVELAYNGPNGRPQFIEAPSNVVVHVGQEVTIPCRTSGNPEPVIQWYRNRERFPPISPNYVVMPSGNLHFRRISLADNGTYTCMAANSLGSVDTSALVIVRNPPRFVTTPRDQTATRGSSVTLECHATGSPEPRIVWLTRGQEIEQSSRRLVMSSGSLLIRSLEDDDEGQYICRAVSAYGHLDQTVTLRVAVPPTFVVRPQNQRVRQEATVDFHCQVTGRPQPHIVWTVNDRAIPDDSRYNLLASGTLRLIRAQPYDSGRYKCEAANSVGSQETTVTLQVVARTPLSFVRSLEDQEVDAGETVSIVCDIRSDDENGNDLYVVWVKDDVRIIPTAGGRFSISTPPTSRLTIRQVGQSDRGRYECRVRSENDAISSSMTLNVRVRSSTEQILSSLADILPAGCLEEGCNPDNMHSDDETVLDAFFYDGEIETFQRTHRRFKRQSALLTVDSLNRVVENSHNVVNRAINGTIAHFNDRRHRQTAGDLLSLMRFPTSQEGIDMAKAAEIFDVSLRVIECCVKRGRRGIPDSEVDFKTINEESEKTVTTDNHNVEEDLAELIGPEVIELVANLSGCSMYRLQPNCSQDFCYHRKYRTLDGTCNNLQHPMWGASLTPFHRILQPIYENGFNAPIAWNPNQTYNSHPLPSPRSVSFGVLMSGGDMGREARADEQFTHMVMQWGQFVDHDLDFTTMAPSIQRFSDGLACKDTCDRQAPCFPIMVDANDARHGRFHHRHHHRHHRQHNDKSCMEFTRSSAVCGSGITSVFFNILSRREQINQITSYMDGSNVYGSTEREAKNLRDLSEDTGLLKEGQALENGHKPLLPYNVYSDLGPESTVIRPVAPIECRRGDTETARQRSVPCFLAGDLRCNEQVALTSMHTIWMREHNRIARYLKKLNPQWEGDQIYSETRKIVGAQMQHITYLHWLPKLLGPFMEQIGAYGGYNPNQPASIVNVFATAAYRFGHTMINPILYRLNSTWHEYEHGHLQLHQAFFAPFRIVHEGGIDPLIRGLIAKPMKKRDTDSSMNAELIERLFELAESVALDLGALNVQRGRDHALPFYNDWREFCNLTVARTFDDLAPEIRSPEVRAKLEELYKTPHNIDPFVGMIVEDIIPGSRLGPTLGCLLSEQFKRTRNGDRFWYENPGIFSPQQLTSLKQASLARVICDNTDDITTIPRDVFSIQPIADFVSCDEIPSIDLSAWVDCRGECADPDGEGESSETLSGHVRSFSRKRRESDEEAAKIDEDDDENEAVVAKVETIQVLLGAVQKLTSQLRELQKDVNTLKKHQNTDDHMDD